MKLTASNSFHSVQIKQRNLQKFTTMFRKMITTSFKTQLMILIWMMTVKPIMCVYPPGNRWI